ncbi:extracellular signal-regulated kinase 1-like [Trichogramma pretiosum]|uniref:extracellular signal-regulated kinase 1-like n=1 Tax=Trichogramma pretiosum TaxID=7493 RepID=UPI000C7195BE|nr:extracellular signal-regulated kinase 1-like [Trichogramma pretiosum]
MVEGGYLHCLPHISSYNVFIKTEDIHPRETLSEAQKEKFNSVMKCIHGQETPEQLKERKKIGNRKQDQKQDQIKQDQMQDEHGAQDKTVKKIPVMWYHKDASGANFYKMPSGGSKEIILDVKTHYTVDKITEKCIEAFKNELNHNYFEKSFIEIGRKNHDVIIDFDLKPIADKNIMVVSDMNKCKKDQNSKENSSPSISLDQMPSCNSIFKTPVISRIKSSPLKKKVSVEFSEQLNVPTKKSKISHINDVRNVKIDVAIEVPMSDFTFPDVVLGRGAFGEVRKGDWNFTEVAIKTIDLLQEDPKDIIKEVAILRQVVHKNIVSIMGYAMSNNDFYIIMELVDGYTLMELIFKDRIKCIFPLDTSDKIQITFQILLGLAFLHGFPKKIVHRDIKPANILLTKEKGVKICDLGVSKINELYTQLMTTHGRVNCAGTPMYMAPEIYINRQQATEYSDMWSFACTIVELFNEKHVWRIANSQKNLVKLLKEKRTPECDNLPDIIKAQVKK